MKRMKKLLLSVAFLCLMCSAMTNLTVSAAEVNAVASAKTVTGGKWVKNTKGRRYKSSSGKYLKNAWIKESGQVYRLKADGYCETGWFTWNGKKYYADRQGAVCYNRWLTSKSGRYYFASSGVCLTSKWKKLDGKYYYFTKSGKMAANQTIGSYYVNPFGVRVISCWVKKGGKLYFYGKDGKKMSSAWVKNTKGYRYLGSDGAMLTNQWVGKYYVGSDGYRLTNCEKDGYWLNEKGARVVKVFRGSYIYVGDSRMVGMYSTTAPGDSLFIAKVGEGYTWLRNQGGMKLKYYLNANPDVKVIFCCGVNDLGNIDQYISYYRELLAQYPDTEFYMLSVNPVDDEYLKANKPINYQWVNDELIRAFNKKLKAAFTTRYLNCYSYLKKNGFTAADGVHYSKDTYDKIFYYIKRKTA